MVKKLEKDVKKARMIPSEFVKRMTKVTGGYRRKTRHKLRKRPRDRGKISTSRLFQEFKIGEKVRIMQEPAVHEGMPHPIYKNKIGTISEKRGNSFIINIKDGSKTKHLISSPIHLTKLGKNGS